jgi:hypothetical protein
MSHYRRLEPESLSDTGAGAKEISDKLRENADTARIQAPHSDGPHQGFLCSHGKSQAVSTNKGYLNALLVKNRKNLSAKSPEATKPV